MSTQDPASYTVIQLKEKLRELGLSTTGSKNELLGRLHEADPTGNWTIRVTETLRPNETDHEDRDELDTEAGASAAHRREIDMYRRERELAERELRMMRREIELLKETQQLNATNRGAVERDSAPRDVAKASISAIADLLSHFDGSVGNYKNWEQQLKLLKKTYRLTDDYVKILIGMRLKGKASEWFQSKAEHIELSVDDLLVELREMYDHRPSRVKLRKQFEGRIWKPNETFHQYVHEKVILANEVPIPEDEVLEYIIDGIPEVSLRDQARIGQISTRASLLKAFEKVTLKDKSSSVGNAERRRQTSREQSRAGDKDANKSEKKETSEKKEKTSSGNERRCFNCGQRDHVATSCPTTAEGPKCFRCGARGHIAAKCVKKQSEVSSVDASADKKSDKYIKDVRIGDCVMIALIDTGSDICIMRASAYIRLGCPRLKLNEIRFRGIGATNNSTMGEFDTELTIDGHTHPILVRVVPDTLMSQDLLVGTDFLNSVELTIKAGKIIISPLSERASVDNDLPEILQIDVDCEKNDFDVSHVPELKYREKVKELVRNYKPNKTREVDLKMSIILKDDEPVYQRARRLAMPERESVNAQVNEWMHEGVIQPSLSDYASPIVLAKKKDGSMRLCVDYRLLNRKIIKDRYPLPLIEDQLDSLQGARLYSTLDLKNGFFHVKVDERSRKYTAFVATMNKKDLCVRVARWALLLEEFQYRVEHRPGKNMQHVDALSRHPLPECNLIDRERDGLTARLKKAQLEDDDIKKIIELGESGRASDYVVRGGLLFRESTGELLIVVPKSMQSQVIRQAHEMGHFSVAKTEAVLRNDYWIPNAKVKIEKIIRNCIACILAERKRGKQEGFLNPIAKGEVPLDTYHIDHLGPLPSAKKSYRHIFAVIDSFSKFVWLYTIKTTNTSEVLDKLRKQALIFGNPRRIISDRGTAFTSNDFSEYCMSENIEHVSITTGVPRANGQVERVNRTIIPLLTKLAGPKHDEWHKYLGRAQQYMNTTMHRSLGMDPFYLLFGAKARLRDNPEIRKLIEEEWIETFRKNRDELRERAIENISKI